MRKFLLRSTLFISILVAYLVANYLINRILIIKNPPKVHAATLVMGDSHTMTSIDPGLLKRAQNISQSAEPYPVSYFKLKELIKFNKIDTIYLGFSFQNISAFNDKKFSDPEWSKEMFDRTYSLIPLSSLEDFEIDRMTYSRSVFENMMIFPKANHLTYLGSFKKLRKILRKSKNKPQIAINRHFYFKKEVIEISNLSISYLDSIRQVTEDNHIFLILINTPLHRSYRELIPKEIKDSYYKLAEDLTQKNINVFDYSERELPDEYFADYDHLNFQGAQAFTKLVFQNQ